MRYRWRVIVESNIAIQLTENNNETYVYMGKSYETLQIIHTDIAENRAEICRMIQEIFDIKKTDWSGSDL